MNETKVTPTSGIESGQGNATPPQNPTNDRVNPSVVGSTPPSGNPATPVNSQGLNSSLVEFNGEKLTQDQVIERLKSYNELQKKFTQTSQELASIKKGPPQGQAVPPQGTPQAPTSLSPSQMAMREEFKSMGFLPVDEVQKMIESAVNGVLPKAVESASSGAKVQSMFQSEVQKHNLPLETIDAMWQFIQQNPNTDLSPEQILWVIKPDQMQKALLNGAGNPQLPVTDKGPGSTVTPSQLPSGGKKVYSFADNSAQRAGIEYLRSRGYSE